jgi:hypothetical protein
MRDQNEITMVVSGSIMLTLFFVQIIRTVNTNGTNKFSVANSWQNFSARSTKKFGRMQKSSAPHKMYS